MTKRVPGSERTREVLNELLAGRLQMENAKSEFVKQATRLIIEEGLEAEVRDALGRGYYEHGVEAGGGHRNGVREGRLKTAEGLVAYSAPQVANTPEPFRSELRAHLKGRDDDLVTVAPMLERIPDWRAYLRSGLKESERELLRHHERTGRPLGSKDFIAALERQLRRPLKKRKPGPKKDGGKGAGRGSKRRAPQQR